MTAFTGINFRGGEEYWNLSGPVLMARTATCRACKVSVHKGEEVMVRDGRKLRFFYHTKCFTGDADPRSQENSSFIKRPDYHKKTAPAIR